MTWVTAWILVGNVNFHQPSYPPFKTKTDCEAVAKVFNGKSGLIWGYCVEITILIKN